MRFQIGWDAGMLPMHAVENKAAHKDWNRATMQKKSKKKSGIIMVVTLRSRMH